MNRDILSKFMIFAAGIGVGSVVTWKLVKDKYAQIAQEEIESVKEAFSTRESENDAESESDKNRETTAEDIIKNEGYASDPSEKEEETTMVKPHVIAPEEFGECDYETVTLWYFTDGVLTNDRRKILKNADELVGENFADHFGEYEEDPDTVYVRNDKQKIDYEILRDYRAYSEVR